MKKVVIIKCPNCNKLWEYPDTYLILRSEWDICLECDHRFDITKNIKEGEFVW